MNELGWGGGVAASTGQDLGEHHPGLRAPLSLQEMRRPGNTQEMLGDQQRGGPWQGHRLHVLKQWERPIGPRD